MKLNIRDLLFAFGAGYLYGRSVKRREEDKNDKGCVVTDPCLDKIYSTRERFMQRKERFMQRKENFESNYSQPVGDLHTGITRVDYDGLHLSKTKDKLYTGNKIIKSNYS